MLARIIAIGLIFLVAIIIALFGLLIEEKQKKIREKINNIFRFK